MRIIYDCFLRVLVIYNFHRNLRDFYVQSERKSLFHIKKAILQFRFNVIMVRSETEEKPQGFNYPAKRRRRKTKCETTIYAFLCVG